jgi:hypothetical protein
VQATSTSRFCSTGHANHNRFGTLFSMTALFTNKDCRDSFSKLVPTMLHEMLEAATDPDPQTWGGWKPELADSCDGTTKFLYGAVEPYWSNSDNGCNNSIQKISPFTPTIKKVSACGSGKHMRITLDGNFGPSPWDLGGSGHGGDETSFLKIRNQPFTLFDVPSSFPFGLGKITWKPNSIVIHGFDDRYGGKGPNFQSGAKLYVGVASALTG